MHLLSVPVFIAVLGLTRMLVAGLEAAGLASLRPLLLLQLRDDDQHHTIRDACGRSIIQKRSG